MGSHKGLNTVTPEQVEAKIGSESTFYKDFVEFLTNLTLHCYHWIIEPRISVFEK